MINRRNLLKAGGGSLAIAGMGLNLASPASAASPFKWSLASAKALVGQTFWLNHPVLRAVSLRLDSVVQPKTAAPSIGHQQFTLRFAVTGVPAMKADTYDIEHPAVGHFALYLTPDKRTGADSVYSADFNLLA